jgi:hypothetical protein
MKDRLLEGRRVLEPVDDLCVAVVVVVVVVVVGEREREYLLCVRIWTDGARVDAPIYQRAFI